jgi:hypothetical protein
LQAATRKRGEAHFKQRKALRTPEITVSSHTAPRQSALRSFAGREFDTAARVNAHFQQVIAANRH